MEFSSRQDAGRKLAESLQQRHVRADLVLGLPRGGVIVAAEVAHTLGTPLDVLVVRKIGHPRFREYAVGALAEGDVVVMDEAALQRTGVRQSELEAVIAEERDRLIEYQLRFEQSASPNLQEKTVILVDDGIATGLTTEAAIVSAKKRKAAKVFLAVPVASQSAVTRLSPLADEIFALLVDPEFDAVGGYYRHFTQTSDEEVLEVLNAFRRQSQPRHTP
jgi:putative phosphoribosyl transferase